MYRNNKMNVKYDIALRFRKSEVDFVCNLHISISLFWPPQFDMKIKEYSITDTRQSTFVKEVMGGLMYTETIIHFNLEYLNRVK